MSGKHAAPRKRPSARAFTAASLAILAGLTGGVSTASAETLLPGIDVSRWQGTINWAQVAGAGIKVPIIKSTGGDGGLYVDSKASYNASQINQRYSQKVYYHFNGPQDGATQAEWQSAHLAGFRDGDVVAYDAEGSYVNPTRVYQWAVRMHALRPTAKLWVYMSQSVSHAYNWQAVVGLGYVNLWVAQYFYSGGTAHNPSVGYWSTWAAWQWTSSGRVSGISGNIDRDQVKQSAWDGQVIGTSGGSAGTVSYAHYYNGYRVSTIQRLMNARVNAGLVVDDIYGTRTRAAVRSFQTWVNNTYRSGIAVDGSYGRVTNAWAQTVSSDGVGGSITISRAEVLAGISPDGYLSGQRYSTRAYARGITSRRWGSTGSLLVKRIQRDLTARGYYHGEIDGRWEHGTSMAMQQRLRDIGLYHGEIDGYFGPKSTAAWQSLLNRYQLD